MKTNQVRRQTSRATQSKQANANAAASPQPALRESESIGTDPVPLPVSLAAEAEAMCRREGLTFSQLMERALRREMTAPASPQTELQKEAASLLEQRNSDNSLENAVNEVAALFHLLAVRLQSENVLTSGVAVGIDHLTDHTLQTLTTAWRNVSAEKFAFRKIVRASGERRCEVKTIRAATAKAQLWNAAEYKLMRLRECPLPNQMSICETPARAVRYWHTHVVKHPAFNADAECAVAIMLNTRRRVMGHYLIATGTLDTLLIHAREVFRLSIVANAAAIVLMHNHPSGDPSPSDSDVLVTRVLIRAGRLLKLELLDHVIIGARSKYASLRGLGFFYK